MLQYLQKVNIFQNVNYCYKEKLLDDTRTGKRGKEKQLSLRQCKLLKDVKSQCSADYCRSDTLLRHVSNTRQSDVTEIKSEGDTGLHYHNLGYVLDLHSIKNSFARSLHERCGKSRPLDKITLCSIDEIR